MEYPSKETRRWMINLILVLFCWWVLVEIRRGTQVQEAQPLTIEYLGQDTRRKHWRNIATGVCYYTDVDGSGLFFTEPCPNYRK